VIGSWFGTGPDRGLALMFTLAGLIGVVVTVAARTSRSYARLAGGAETEAGASVVPVRGADPVVAIGGCPDLANCAAA
jgi:DHA3 family multidrug efflux protein-like MFS transporter